MQRELKTEDSEFGFHVKRGAGSRAGAGEVSEPSGTAVCLPLTRGPMSPDDFSAAEEAQRES